MFNSIDDHIINTFVHPLITISMILSSFARVKRDSIYSLENVMFSMCSLYSRNQKLLLWTAAKISSKWKRRREKSHQNRMKFVHISLFNGSLIHAHMYRDDVFHNFFNFFPSSSSSFSSYSSLFDVCFTSHMHTH